MVPYNFGLVLALDMHETLLGWVTKTLLHQYQEVLVHVWKHFLHVYNGACSKFSPVYIRGAQWKPQQRNAKYCCSIIEGTNKLILVFHKAEKSRHEILALISISVLIPTWKLYSIHKCSMYQITPLLLEKCPFWFWAACKLHITCELKVQTSIMNDLFLISHLVCHFKCNSNTMVTRLMSTKL